MSARWSLRGAGQDWTIEGEVGATDAPALAAALVDLPGDGPIRLELEDLDLLDGVSVAETVTAIRALARRRAPLTLRHAPQMLAHTLYKRGLLVEEPIALDAPRHDEGFGSS